MATPLVLPPLFNALPGAYLILSPALVIEAVTDAYLAITLLERAQLVGQPLFDALPERPHAPEAHAERNLRASLAQVLATGQPHEMAPQQLDMPDPARPGHFLERHWLVRNLPVLDAQGAVTSIIHSTVNITEQVLAEAQLQASQAREQAARLAADARAEELAATQRQVQARETFYQLFAHTPAAICIQRGPEHRYEYVNAAYQQFFPGRQLVGLPVAEALPEIIPAGLLPLLDGVYQTGETYFGHEIPLRLAQAADSPNRARYFTFTYQAYREAGEIVGISTFAYEVTGQVLARQASEEQARQFRLLADALPALIARVDAQERYVFANQAYETWYGVRAADLVGRPVREVMGEEAFARGQDTRAQAQAGKRVAFEATMAFRPDFIRHIHGHLIPYVEYGRAAGYYILISDVTDLVNAWRAAEASARRAHTLADELHQANQQLTRTNVDLDNFVNLASHDLRAPITNVAGLLTVLREQLPIEVAQAGLMPRVLTMLQRSVKRFQLTLSQLAEAARLQQVQEQAPESVNLAALVQDVRLDLAPLLAETQAQLVVEVATCPELRFTPAHLRSIVYNLLSNAVKYRHPDRSPLVHLHTHCTETMAVLEVQDNGLGLDKRQQAALFRLGGRLHTHVEGTGVGLHMIKRLVENAGGTITVQSEPGVGSTFRVTLPC